MTIEELNLAPLERATKEIFINGQSVNVKPSLSFADRTEMIYWILNNSVDANTGMVSPIKTTVYIALGIVRWYSDIDLPDDVLGKDPRALYDLLEDNGVFDSIANVINEKEYKNLVALLQQTIDEYRKFNYSAYGILNSLTSSSADLAEQARKTIESVKDREGIELLGAIKDIVGQN